MTAFLRKTWEILNTPGHAPLISWNDAGDSIVIHQVTKFSDKVLPQYFKHSNYASFVRQLNMYGFHKTSPDPSCREFKHEYFQRDHPELLSHIKRKVSIKGSRGAGASTPSGAAAAAPAAQASSADSNPTADKLLQEVAELRARQQQLEESVSELQSEKEFLEDEVTELRNMVHQGSVRQRAMAKRVERILYAMYKLAQHRLGSSVELPAWEDLRQASLISGADANYGLTDEPAEYAGAAGSSANSLLSPLVVASSRPTHAAAAAAAAHHSSEPAAAAAHHQIGTGHGGLPTAQATHKGNAALSRFLSQMLGYGQHNPALLADAPRDPPSLLNSPKIAPQPVMSPPALRADTGVSDFAVPASVGRSVASTARGMSDVLHPVPSLLASHLPPPPDDDMGSFHSGKFSAPDSGLGPGAPMFHAGVKRARKEGPPAGPPSPTGLRALSLRSLEDVRNASSVIRDAQTSVLGDLVTQEADLSEQYPDLLIGAPDEGMDDLHSETRLYDMDASTPHTRTSHDDGGL